ARAIGASEPELVPHLDEIADHVRSDAQERIRAGSTESSAFTAAIAAFGPLREVASGFAASRHRARDRAAAVYAASMIIGTLVMTGLVVAIDKLVQPLDLRWFVVLYLPVLLASSLYFELFRKRERAA